MITAAEADLENQADSIPRSDGGWSSDAENDSKLISSCTWKIIIYLVVHAVVGFFGTALNVFWGVDVWMYHMK